MKTIKELLELHGNEYAYIEIKFVNFGGSQEVTSRYGRLENKEMTGTNFKSLSALKQFIESKFDKTVDTVETAEAQLDEELCNCGVGLNKDGSCPSCEADKADYLREA